MKLFTFYFAALSIFLTLGQPIWADELWDQPEAPAGGETSADLHLNPRLNVLAGVGNLTAEGGSRAERFAGGVTFEAGQSWRTIETGLLLIPTGGESKSRSLALPMWAKFRIAEVHSLSLFLKAGAAPSFETSSARDRDTRNLDVLVGGGVGARVRVADGIALVCDVTYNRGLLDHLRTTAGSNLQAGTLILAGVSFSL